MLFTMALKKAGVKFEQHIYPQGAHGLSLANRETARYENPERSIQPECAAWINMAGRFVKEEL